MIGRQRREFAHNEYMSKATAARKKEEKRLAAKEKSMLARSKMHANAASREQQNAFDFDKEKLDNNRIQAEVNAPLR